MSKYKVILAAVATMLAETCYGQSIRPSYSYPSAPVTGVRMGDSPAYATPFVGIAVGRDDNLYQSNTNEKASTLYVVSPGIKVDARTSSAFFQGKYQTQIGRYNGSGDDDYIDHSALNQLDLKFGSRAFARVGLDYNRAHDPRGSTDRAFSSSPDRYRTIAPSATIAYGVPGAAGRVEVYANQLDKEYLNNRDVTQAADFRRSEFGGAFYWRVMPKTYAVVEARQANISYDLANSPNSGRERRYLAGVSWEATAATTGTVKFGRLTRRPDVGEPEFSGTTWEAIVSWAPRTYSTFDFYSTRQTTEASGLGRFIVTEATGVNWNHAWNSYVATGVQARFQRDEFQGFDRTDEIKSIGFRVGYKMRNWLTLGAEYNFIHRDSNNNSFEYDRNLYLLTATASM